VAIDADRVDPDHHGRQAAHQHDQILKMPECAVVDVDLGVELDALIAKLRAVAERR